MSDGWKPGRKLVIGYCRPDYWLEEDGTETPIDYKDDDQRIGGYDNPYDEGDDPRIGVDCFERAYPPAPYTPTARWEDSLLYDPDSDFWRS